MYNAIAEYSKLSDKQRQELKMKDNDHVLSQELIEKMEHEIALANLRMKEEEKLYEEKITAQAQRVKDKEYEVEVMHLRVKEKEKEIRL